MKRSELREHLFLMLFRRDFYPKEELKEQAVFYLESAESYAESLENDEFSLMEEDRLFLEKRYADVMDKLDEIDAMIDEVSIGWKISRIGKVELAIIRLAVFEMKFDEQIPTGVAINEAVELAKKFGEDNSFGFVNGILAKLTE